MSYKWWFILFISLLLEGCQRQPQNHVYRPSPTPIVELTHAGDVSYIKIDKIGLLYAYCLNCKGVKEMTCVTSKENYQELKCVKDKK